MKFLPEENVMQVFAGIGRVRWDRGEETANDVEDYFNLGNLKKETKRQKAWLIGSKGSGKKNYEIFSGKPLEEYREENGDTECNPGNPQLCEEGKDRYECIGNAWIYKGSFPPVCTAADADCG